MADFFGAWGFVLVLGSPFIVLLLATIFLTKKNNPQGYQMWRLNLFIYFIYSFLVALYAYVLDSKPGNGGAGFAARFTVIQIYIPHLIFYWAWLFIKPKSGISSETTEKNSTLKDPILDEEPPKQS
jgi:hypothetical protein